MMKLILKNFRCHEDCEYEIPSIGLVLLSGSSGSGKSTILNAIVYVLYGTLRKPYTHGKTTCSVELITDEYSIYRSSKPNKIIVKWQNKEYENDAATNAIYDIIGMSCSEFMASSYVSQRIDSSILSLTPTEQLKFIELLALSDDSHIKNREIIKDAYKTTSIQKTRLETEMKLLIKQLEEKQSASPPKDIPKDVNLEKLKSRNKILNESVDQLIDNINSSTNQKRLLQNDEKKYSELKENKNKLEGEISTLADLINDKNIDTIKYEKLEGEYNECKIELTNARNYFLLSNKKQELEELKNKYFQELKDQLKSLQEDKLNVNADEIVKLTKQLDEQKKQVFEIEKLKKNHEEAVKKSLEIITEIKNAKYIPLKKMDVASVIKELKIIYETIGKEGEKIKEAMTTFTCPHCSKCLSIDYDTRKTSKSSSKKISDQEFTSFENKLVEINAKYEELEVWIETLTELNDKLSIKIREIPNINVLETKLSCIKDLHKEIAIIKKKIETRTLPSTFDSLIASIKKINVDKKYKPKYKTLAITEKTIQNISVEYEKLSEQVSEVEKLKTIIDTKKKTLDSINSKLSTINIDTKNIQELNNTIDQYTIKLNEINEEISNNNKILMKFSDYIRYQECLNSIKLIKKSIEDYKKELIQVNDYLASILIIEEASKQAENLAMEETINNINTHAKIYLDQMFESDITVQLRNFTELKTRDEVKFGISTYLQYKDEVYENIDQLSGGERQRCNLAFLLAINDMLGSKMLLLDECLNNLDPSLNSEVLLYLKELYSDKLVLVVSHEAVHGCFDFIVNV